MKKLLVFSILLYCSYTADAQKIKVPKAIKMTFNNMYTGIQADRWYNDFEGSYTAFIMHEGSQKKVKIDYSGQWISTSTIIVSDYSTCVTAYVKTKFPTGEIVGMEILETNDSKYPVKDLVLVKVPEPVQDTTKNVFWKLTFNKKCKLITQEQME